MSKKTVINADVLRSLCADFQTIPHTKTEWECYVMPKGVAYYTVLVRASSEELVLREAVDVMRQHKTNKKGK